MGVHGRELDTWVAFAEMGRAKSLAEFREKGVDRLGWNLGARSEEHTSELQSLMRISYAVFCLKKKKKNTRKTNFKKQYQTLKDNAINHTLHRSTLESSSICI